MHLLQACSLGWPRAELSYMQLCLQDGSAMSLPFMPCTLTFNNLHYMVPLPAQMKDSPSAITGPGGAKELELLRVRPCIHATRIRCCVCGTAGTVLTAWHPGSCVLGLVGTRVELRANMPANVQSPSACVCVGTFCHCSVL